MLTMQTHRYTPHVRQAMAPNTVMAPECSMARITLMARVQGRIPDILVLCDQQITITTARLYMNQFVRRATRLSSACTPISAWLCEQGSVLSISMYWLHMKSAIRLFKVQVMAVGIINTSGLAHIMDQSCSTMVATINATDIACLLRRWTCAPLAGGVTSAILSACSAEVVKFRTGHGPLKPIAHQYRTAYVE
jgi:hypothetical protein